ncbi:MAG: hypothetical protein OEY89_04035 [Gammaproteobacteria bacterium]|nr:hypothetical protein [Gammaproteobacteria bacterium]
MKQLMKYTGEYLDFCAHMFWGRWDVSLMRIGLLFSMAVILIYVGRSQNILFGELSAGSVVSTALVATAITLILGFARKRRVL